MLLLLAEYLQQFYKGFAVFQYLSPVSYTHLTLPTN